MMNRFHLLPIISKTRLNSKCALFSDSKSIYL
jgi:hypothetical protein